MNKIKRKVTHFGVKGFLNNFNFGIFVLKTKVLKRERVDSTGGCNSTKKHFNFTKLCRHIGYNHLVVISRNFFTFYKVAIL